MSANLDVFIDFADVQEAAKYIRPEPPFFSQQLYSEYLICCGGSTDEEEHKSSKAVG